MAATKASTKKATPRAKASTTRGSRQRKAVVSMSAEVKAAAAAALGLFEERLMDTADMVGASTRNLKGGNGVIKTVRLGTDGNKHRATITVRYR